MVGGVVVAMTREQAIDEAVRSCMHPRTIRRVLSGAKNAEDIRATCTPYGPEDTKSDLNKAHSSWFCNSIADLALWRYDRRVEAIRREFRRICEVSRG